MLLLILIECCYVDKICVGNGTSILRVISDCFALDEFFQEDDIVVEVEIVLSLDGDLKYESDREEDKSPMIERLEQISTLLFGYSVKSFEIAIAAFVVDYENDPLLENLLPWEMNAIID